jgi:predicted nucleic acid-binding protein
MRTAVGSSALLALFRGEPDAHAWLATLIEARRRGQLVVCDVVYAEVAAAFGEPAALDDALAKLGIQLDPIGAQAAWRAGRTFRAYRDAGGPRTHLIPDFLIGAHAAVQADQLAAADRGYLRRYFAGLPLVHP